MIFFRNHIYKHCYLCRITGTNNFDPNLEIPKEILENNWDVREKTWNHLFDKYSEKPSDDTQVNIITGEPEEESSEEEHSCGQRIRMHKSASLIQYWINTGNPPYKTFLNEKEDIGSSLSEEENISSSEEESISLKQTSSLFDKNNEQECRNHSSSSSVDTAAYILSNANITKKIDTMAIIKDAKCPNIISSKNMKDVKTISNDKTEYVRIARSDQCDYSDDNVNTNLPNSEIFIEHVSKVHTQPSTIISNDTLQPNILQYSSHEKIDKINTSKLSPKQLDVRNIHDIASIFQQFDKTSQRLAGNDKENITLAQIEMNRDTSDVKQVSASTIMTEMSKNNTTMISQRKLYTGRNSPIDLTLINRRNTNRLSQTNHSLHPALDTDCTITRKIKFSSCKNKNKHRSLLDKKGLDFKKRRSERKCSKFIKNYRDSYNSTSSFSQNLSNSYNNSDTQDNSPFYKRKMIQENNDTNSFIKDEIYKQDLASLNLNPVVLLERITSSFKHKPSFVKKNHNMQENSVHNKHFVKTSKKCNSKNEDLESRSSNSSTILICECGKDVSQKEESSDSSFELRLSVDDNNPVKDIEKKADKLSSSKDINTIQTKELHILESLPLLPNKNINTTVTSQVLNKDDDIKQKKVLDKSQMHLYGTNEIGSLNLKEIKISLSRTNENCIDSIKSQILNKNDAIQQKEVLRESEACFSNSYKTNNKDNIKLREVKVVLEQLPTNIGLKKSITDVNLYSDKKEISQNTSLRNNKIESPIDNNSLKMCIKSKKNDKLSDTSDIVSEHENQVSDKVKSNSANYKCSILSFTSSDEDDFVKFLRKSPKRLKRSSKPIDSKIFNVTSTVNNRNLNTVIFSSKKVTPEKIYNSIVENLIERDKTVSSVIVNNSRHSDTVINRNEIDCKNDTNIIFQTKTDYTDYTDSLHSQEGNSHTTFRKAIKSSSMQSRSRYSNHINKERLFKGSTRNRYTIDFSSSSNSSIEESQSDITKRSYNMLLRSPSNKKTQVSKQLANEEFNDISLRSNINNTKKNNKSLSFINDKQDTSVENETFVSTSFGKNNLSNFSANKQIPDKSKNSVAMQENGSATVRKLLRFQTKSYYDSDSSMSS
ncbi:putative leucine-rich repeat-containing protein DDB_G0290503 isoform X2 [Linepithema humile]|uniref:putative leucine-rich repeat-containing protein DDB_G0290503 isoform X2 n=1 Tax=Linepithema humile TaxID=83485 RepID=UPI00351F6682